jgi:lipoteichoic acid synthase
VTAADPWVDSRAVTKTDTEVRIDRPGLARRIGALLAPGHWFYLLALLVPPMLVALIFQTIRLSAVGTTIGSWAYFDKLHSDIAFHLAIICFWVGAFSIVRRRGSRRALVFALHVFFTMLSLMIIMTHLFFYMLDLMPNMASFKLLTLVFQVAAVQIIRAEANAWLVGVAFAGAIAANFFPHLTNRWFSPRRLSQPPADPQPQPFSTRRIVVGTAAICTILLTISALPNISDSTNFTRNRAVSMPMDAIEDQIEGQPPGFVAPTKADIPDQTRLVETARTKKRNVVFIVLESHGRVSTTLGDPSLDTTPVMSELAKTSLEARRAFTVVPNTTKSMLTSNCGVAPPPDTTNSEARPGGLASKCIARLLDEQGYDTAYFQSATRTFEKRDKVVRGLGFDDFFAEESYKKAGFSPVNTLGYEDDIMVGPSLDWAKARKGAPFFMEYLTVTAHTKYVLPKGFPVKHYTDDVKHNDYLNAVRYQDRFVGKVIDGFEKAGLADNTIFIVTGDHGEGFRQHGRRLHSDVIWSEGLQIPLLIKAPGRWTNGAKLDHTVQNMSILPTIVDLLGFDVAGGKYHASSILDAENNPEPRISHCWNVDQCAAYFPDDRHAFLYFYDYRAPEYYDLSQDPLEKHNIIESLPGEKQDAYERTMKAWVAETRATHDLSRRLAAGKTP